eukprot:5495039-Karenia_brevis.AAC.1
MTLLNANEVNGLLIELKLQDLHFAEHPGASNARLRPPLLMREKCPDIRGGDSDLALSIIVGVYCMHNGASHQAR